MAHLSYAANAANRSTLLNELATFGIKFNYAVSSLFSSLTETVVEDRKRDRLARALHSLSERQLQGGFRAALFLCRNFAAATAPNRPARRGASITV